MSLTNLETIRVDDIPLLIAIIAEMGIQERIDQEVTPHGHWQGISVGTIVMIWLCYILTEQDHRLEPVQSWVKEQQELFNRLLGIALRETDLTDDRLANVLTMLGVDEVQSMIDEHLNQEWITLYELPTKVKRFDSTTIAVYQEPKEDPGSLIGYGHSKDHRPDLAQFKVMLSTLEMGMPLTCQTINGKRADDGLYIPAYDAVVRTVGHSRFVAVGDSKMASWGTRAYLSERQSWYLCPFRGTAARGEPLEDWIEEALEKWDELEEVTKVDAHTGEIETIARVYALTRQQSTLTADGEEVSWEERLLISHSSSYQQGMLTRRLQKAERLYAELERLRLPPKKGRKRYRTADELQPVVDTLLHKYKMAGLISVQLKSEPHAHGGERWMVDSYQRQEEAWKKMVARLGWQIYVTSLPPTEYSVAEIIHLYRRQPHLERSISRLKSRSLHIRPLFLRDETRIVGLTWLLVLALRIMVLMEFRVRRELDQRDEVIYGLKAGNKNTATQKPTTEKMLEAFDNITWTKIVLGESETHYHLTPLTDTQKHILDLLNLPHDIYERLASPNPKPLLNLRE